MSGTTGDVADNSPSSQNADLVSPADDLSTSSRGSNDEQELCSDYCGNYSSDTEAKFPTENKSVHPHLNHLKITEFPDRSSYLYIFYLINFNLNHSKL